MSEITHILDTSALLAHYFNEPGADTVQSLWAERDLKLGICAVTIPELRGRLSKELPPHSREAESAADDYLGELTVCVPVDRAVAEIAWQIREATPQRLPLVDALIAATARSTGAILVHKDPHMARIPADLVKQIVL